MFKKFVVLMIVSMITISNLQCSYNYNEDYDYNKVNSVRNRNIESDWEVVEMANSQYVETQKYDQDVERKNKSKKVREKIVKGVLITGGIVAGAVIIGGAGFVGGLALVLKGVGRR